MHHTILIDNDINVQSILYTFMQHLFLLFLFLSKQNIYIFLHKYVSIQIIATLADSPSVSAVATLDKHRHRLIA
jgi:hypothetical protein